MRDPHSTFPECDCEIRVCSKKTFETRGSRLFTVVRCTTLTWWRMGVEVPLAVHTPCLCYTCFLLGEKGDVRMLVQFQGTEQQSCSCPNIGRRLSLYVTHGRRLSRYATHKHSTSRPRVFQERADSLYRQRSYKEGVFKGGSPKVTLTVHKTQNRRTRNMTDNEIRV